MYNLKINFRNYGLSMVPVERMEETIKFVYWDKEEQEHIPQTWRDFDGDINITKLQDEGGDTVKIETDKFWGDILIKFFRKQQDIRSISLLYTPDTEKYIKKLIRNFDDRTQYNTYVALF